MIENLINGNLNDAKEQAGDFNSTAIAHALRDEYGWTPRRSELAAHYLKTGKGYLAYCYAK